MPKRRALCPHRRWSVLGAAIAAMLFSPAAGRAQVDLDGNGLGDVWELKYDAAGLIAGDDTDGDGLTNAQESITGTDPLAATDTVRISTIRLTGTNMSVGWPSIAGKRYRVQSASALYPPDWQNVGAALEGTDGVIEGAYPATPSARYYRVLVQDMDSDGDGLTDWEELALGTDPHNSHSAGTAAQDDYARLIASLGSANTVSIDASDPDASEAGLETGTFTVTRSGNVGPLVVNYAVAGTAVAGTDYETLSGSVKIPLGAKTATIRVKPIADAQLESPESVIATLGAGANYQVGTPQVATVLITDLTGATGGGLLGEYWNEIASGTNQISSTNPAKFAGTATASRTDPAVNFIWPTGTVKGTNSPTTAINTTYYSSRWSGEVLPQYSQVYTFFFDVNRAGRMRVNGQLLVNNWPPNAISIREYSNTITLTGGVRYPIVIEEYATNGGGKAVLSWQSANQPKQVIPQARLFANTPPQITSAREVTLLKNSGAFSYQIVASGSPTSFDAANLPQDWNIDPLSGVISGSPTRAGVWRIPITARNANGAGSAILTLTIVDTAGAITREVWNGAYGSVAMLPLTAQTSGTDLRASLEGPQDPAGDFGSRMRGFVFAPATGVYQFWVSADDAAELWISNDDEPVNLFQRAATTGPTGYRDWANPAAGKSPLLYLKAGQRYYVEVRHVQTGGGHVSVGWTKPTDSPDLTAPSEVVPGYALSPWAPPVSNPAQGTLFTTALTTQGAAQSSGSGFCTLVLSEDERSAVITPTYSNLTGPVTMWHVHNDRIPGGGMANIVFDLDEPGLTRTPEGGIVWPIIGVAGRSAAQIVQDLKDAQIYFNIHTDLYQGGEIKGYLRAQAASQTFTAPGDPPEPPDDHTDAKAAARFLTQATFGASSAEIAAVQSAGYGAWIDAQFNQAPPQSPTLHLPFVEANKNVTDPNARTYPSANTFNSWWKNSINAPDQLRQRVAFALSEILVVSSNGPLFDYGDGLADYYDTLLGNSFGNFRDLLKAASLHPSMGIYLDMRGNDKPNLALGLHPNENYAREIMQLFSIGLNRLHPDGSLLLNSKGLPVATYDQDVIIGYAHAFTGWNYNQPNSGAFLPTSFNPTRDMINPMKPVPQRHFTGQKRILNNVVLPGLPKVSGSIRLDPYATPTTAQIQDPGFQALPAQEIDATHDALFNHPNCGPFICRQLIQRLVTSTPSRGYVYRVVKAFNDNGAGVRGDMKAVIKTILLDYEARSITVAAQVGFGKQREPLLRITALARAFPAPPSLVGTYSQSESVITFNTTTPPRLAAGNTVALSFTDGIPNPATDGSYRIISVSGNSFTAPAPEFLAAKYTLSGTTITIDTTPTGHGVVAAGYVPNTTAVHLRKFSGSPAPPDDAYLVTSYLSATSYTVAAPVELLGTSTGTALQVVYRGQYVQSGSGITVTTTQNHGLANGASAFVHFTPISSSTNVATSGTFSLTRLDDRRFTLTTTGTATRSGYVIVAPNVITASRSGNMAMNISNWKLNSTDNDIKQTPLNSPTVFNFFEPDYQFGGLLSTAGLVTPEFQLTSETNVITQANFLYNGLANPSSSASIYSSFRSGGGHIALDLTAWMQPGPGGAPWTNDANLDALIDQLDTLLNARLSSAAKTKIRTYVGSTANISYSSTNPTDAQKRDRVRAIVHLISTSADFTIQR